MSAKDRVESRRDAWHARCCGERAAIDSIA
jgi:hypothetical protein